MRATLLTPIISRTGLRQASHLRRLYATASATPHGSDRAVKIIEVGPRDGLQNEKKPIPLDTKVELIRRLASTGLTNIEAGSFVSPKWVPQMADSGRVLEELLNGAAPSTDPMCFSFLVPNERGLIDFHKVLSQNPGKYATESSPADNDAIPEIEVAIFAAASEAFSLKNLNMDIESSLEKFRNVITDAKGAGHRVRAYISVVLGCPYTGYDVKPTRVAEIARDLLEMGADEISLGDTTGMGTVPRTKELLKAMTAAGIRNEDIAMHFHDTYNQAMVNTVVALDHGIRKFDSSVGGLGGCPYSPGATGNVATENMLYFMDSVGMSTGVDLDAVAKIGGWISQELGKPNDSTVGRALLAAQGRKQAL
ncbi:hypothetical protein TD95_001958 [Thielaviopsis punctulata]|uniref:hydroxymethylglutaryl-CoA lyase n=1 Tax=Thielaviopsis punctulata TaxID=72032 RepID=A0A0F4ZGL2_9PEZI|nr:hypothetical protein TD95_001958 [Thielaviopsis punctulata]